MRSVASCGSPSSPPAGGVCSPKAEATVSIEGPAGPRTLALADFLLGPRRVALDPGEWILDVTMARNAVTGGFRKIGGRRAQSIAILSLAWQWQAGTDGRLHQVRLAMGAAEAGLAEIAAEGTQQAIVGQMQTRARLYELVDYAGYAAFDTDIFTSTDPDHSTWT